MKLYFREAQYKTFANIKELLEYGYTYATKDYHHGFCPTYTDPACTQQQCHCARRSFEDLLAICRAYFPRTTKRHLAKALYELHESRTVPFNIFICRDIQKMVFQRDSYDVWAYNFRPERGSYGQYDPNEKADGNYSMNCIMKLLRMKPFKKH